MYGCRPSDIYHGDAADYLFDVEVACAVQRAERLGGARGGDRSWVVYKSN